MLKKIIFGQISPGLFRLLLALLVMVYHSVDFLSLGHYAVYVFFMLSGYWIFKMYSEKYRTYKNSYLVYITSRLARLMPMYWFILLFSVAIYSLIPDLSQKVNLVRYQPGSVGLTNLLIIGVANSPFSFIGTTWSLDIEIQFYILAPLLFLAARKTLFLMLALFSTIAIGLIFTHYSLVNILVYMPYFIIGGGIYLFNYKASQKLVMYCLFIIVAILTFSYMIPGIRTAYLLGRETYVLGFNSREAINVILAVLTIPFVSVNVRLAVRKELLGREQVWSSMSYIIYLLHWPLLQFYAYNAMGAGLVKKSAFLLLYYIVCIFLGYVLAKFVDARFERYRKGWVERQERRIAVAGVNQA